MIKAIQEYYETLNGKSRHTVRSYKYAIDLFVAYFNPNSIEDLKKLDAGDIQHWLNNLLKSSDSKNEDTAKNTANARLRVIKAFFNWMVERNYLEESCCNAIQLFKEKKSVKVYLTQQEQLKMLNSCNNIKTKLMISMAFYTGMRRHELVNIRLDDIYQSEGDTYILVHGKGNKERRVILNEYTEDILNEYLTTRTDGCPYLFVTSRVGFNDDYDGETHPITAESYRQSFKLAAEKAGISSDRLDKISTHTARRSFAVGLIKHYGASSFQVQKALGHSSIRTTERYLEAAGSEIADNVMKMQAPIEMEN